MSDKLVIFKHETGIGVLCPSEEELKIHTLEEIANRDIPEGKKYKIIDSNLDKKVNKLLVINELEKLL